MIAAIAYKFKSKLELIAEFFSAPPVCMPVFQLDGYVIMAIAVVFMIMVINHHQSYAFKKCNPTAAVSATFNPNSMCMMTKDDYIPQLKQLYKTASTGFTNALERVTIDFEKDQKAERLIAYFQFLDILAQRIEHLIGAHQKVMSLYIDELFKESFLHLQYHQFDMIAEDLLELLIELEYDMESIGQNFHLGQPANIHASITNMINEIKDNLKNGAGDLKLRVLPPLTKRQSVICSQLYTMERERIVFRWFQSSGIRQGIDLRYYYKVQVAELQNQNTELF